MKITFFLFSFLIVLNLHSQNSDIFGTSNETFYIQTNDNTYITGETLFYDLMINNTTDTLSSKIVYIELINQKQQVIKQQKATKNNHIKGDIFLKTDLETGIYKLIAYSKKSLLQNNTNFCEIEVSIINPYQSNDSFFVETNDSISPENNIQLIHNEKFNPREKINIKIPEFNSNNISISVKQKNHYSLLNTSKSENKPLKNNSSTLNYANLPEIRGKIISGKVVNYEPKDKITDYISLSTLNDDVVTKISKIEKDGSFIFQLEKPVYTDEILLQPLFEHNSFNIQLDVASFDYSKLIWNNRLKIPKKSLSKINDRAISNQIEIAYYNSKKDTILQNTNNSYFYYPNYKEIKLDDYTRFNTVKEVIVEVLDRVVTKKIDGTNYIFIYNPITNPLKNLPALVLLNGIIVQDYDVLFKLNAKKIDRIELIEDKFYLGAKTYDGLINFISENNILDVNFSPYQIIKITPTLQEKKYYKEDYSESKKNRIPDQRYNLYWNPNVRSNSEVSFYTSDVEGSFLITLDVTEQNGTKKTYTQSFTVEKK